MGSISTGVGLISGINSAQLIESLLGLESQSKIPFQQKVAKFSAAKTALLDVNARLLNLRNASLAFRQSKIFKSALASSSDDKVLTASATADVVPGNYTFIVKNLASTSQKLSKAFASATTPLGLDAMTFEFGQGGLNTDVDLAGLNGGAGVRRGKIVITDKSGKNATIDLSSTTTLNDVISTINSTGGVSVQAAIDGNHLVITDMSGGGGSLTIANASGSFAATDLGIAASTVGSSIAGTQINEIGAGTSLSSLNDGLGVFIRDNVADFTITTSTGTHSIDLGRTDAPIDSQTKLSSLNNGLGVAINSTTDDDFLVRTSTGVTVGVKLGDIKDAQGQVIKDKVTTVGQLLTRVNEELAETLGAGNVVATLRGDGKGFVLTDNLGGIDPLRVLGAGSNNTKTAQNLGIYTGPTGGSGPILTGSVVPNTVATPRASTLNDIITRINEQTSGSAKASIGADGVSLVLEATDGGIISVGAGQPDGSSYATAMSERTARDLGIWGLSGTGSVQGQRLVSSLGSRLVRNLNGGKGLDTGTSLSLTDRSGASVTVNSLNTYTSLSDLIKAVNTAAAGAGVDITIGMNSAGNGLQVNDTSGGAGSLVVAGNAADDLGIAASVATNSHKGSNLNLQYVGFATKTSDLNYGQGLGTGSFRITDSAGSSEVVDIGTDSVTLYDIIQEINSKGLKLEAKLNANGDGILLEDTNLLTPSQAMKVENVSGSVASKLGILKTASTAGGDIDGSYERTIDLNTTDNLNDVISKVNAAGINVKASLLNTGDSGLPYKLAFLSTISGRDGDLLIDAGAVDLGLSTLSQAKDATVFFGSSDPALATVIQSGSNTLTDVVKGLTVNLLAADSDPINVSVTRDTTKITESVKQFVTTFNDVLGRIAAYDKYDAETEKAGPLLGNPTVARVRDRFLSAIQAPAQGIDTAYRQLSQVGIKMGKNGQLTMDEAKFQAAYDADPLAVENLFAALEETPQINKEIAPGITVTSQDSNTTRLGFGDMFDRLVKDLTDSLTGAMALADQGLQKQIDAANDRLERIDERLESRRQILQRQFSAMESALAKIQGQQGSLSSLASNVAFAQTRLSS